MLRSQAVNRSRKRGKSTERRRIEKERHQKAKKLEQFILDLAETQQRRKSVADLLEFISNRQQANDWATDHLVKEIRSYDSYLESRLDSDIVESFPEDLELGQNSPSLMTFLDLGREEQVAWRVPDH